MLCCKEFLADDTELSSSKIFETHPFLILRQSKIRIIYLSSWSLKLVLAVIISRMDLGLLSLQTKGQRCLEFVIRGGGNLAIICFHSSVSGPPSQVIHQFDLQGPVIPSLLRHSRQMGVVLRFSC